LTTPLFEREEPGECANRALGETSHRRTFANFDGLSAETFHRLEVAQPYRLPLGWASRVAGLEPATYGFGDRAYSAL
jgi:hypothetical protein